MTSKRMHQYLVDMAESLNVAVIEDRPDPEMAYSIVPLREIHIAKTMTSLGLFIALHELGHIAHNDIPMMQQDPDKVLHQEVNADEFALMHYPFPVIPEKEMENALLTYVSQGYAYNKSVEDDKILHDLFKDRPDYIEAIEYPQNHRPFPF